MLVYGILDTAFLEQQSSDPSTGATTGRFYLNTTSHEVKWYANSAWRTAMDLNTSQTASNKTFASPLVTTALTLNATAECRFADSDSSNYVGFKAPGTVAANKIWILPNADSTGQQALVSDGALNLSWVSIVTDPMTTRGDLLLRNASNVNDRLPIGAANTGLFTNGTDPSWRKLVNADVDASAAIAYSKLALTGGIVNADVSASAAIAGSKLQASSDVAAGTLNYYKESTAFTATIGTSGTNYSSVTYSGQSGRFTRVGNVVTFTLEIEWTNATGSPTGAIRVGTLPHAAAYRTMFSVRTNNVDLATSSVGVVALMSAGNAYMDLETVRDNTSTAIVDASTNSGATTRYIVISGSYLV